MTRDVLVVGAGFAGAVCAERLANAGHPVVLIDKRPHIAGNAFDTADAHGVLIHPYGPHIFHTHDRSVFEYLSRFTHWRFYEHRVRAVIDGQLYPIPINRTTLNSLYGLQLSEADAAAFLERAREPRHEKRSSEDVVLSSVGRDLCDKFFRGYTLKQWGFDLCDLSAGVAARIPTRTSDDDRYFTDAFNFMPAEGFTKMFECIIDHPLITFVPATDYFGVRDKPWKHVVFTGPIDAFFEYRLGTLPYRSLRFEHEHRPNTQYAQEVGVYNYPDLAVPYTRITEFKHLTGQRHPGTSIVREYAVSQGEPYYPIPRPQNEVLSRQYRDLVASTHGVTFVGRLAEYRYYNMDQVVASALARSQEVLRCI